MTNQRRVLLAQLNTMLRLSRRKEVKRFHGTDRALAARVAKMYKAAR